MLVAIRHVGIVKRIGGIHPIEIKLMHITKFTLKSLLAGLVLASATSHAATVTNFSFETDALAPGGFSGSPPSGWTSSGIGSSGPQRFSTQTPLPTNGINHAYLGGGATLSQLTSETILGGQTYTLTVDIGQESSFTGSLASFRFFGSTSGIGIALSNLNGTAELTNLAPSRGGYLLNQTFTYTALASGDPFAGQTIGIALVGPSTGQILFDNVRFDVVPEPSALLLGGLGTLALLRRRRTV